MSYFLETNTTLPNNNNNNNNNNNMEMSSSPCTHHCLTTCYHYDNEGAASNNYKTLSGPSPVSLYIPRISKRYEEQDVIDAFNDIDIGVVTRVDFAPLVPVAPGQRESAESLSCPYQKAFVHMEYLHDTEIGWTIYDSVVGADNSCRVYPNPKEYWILMNNKMAVPAVNLNVHQIAENHRILEQTVMAQAVQIEKLDEVVNIQATQITRLLELVMNIESTFRKVEQNTEIK